MSQEWQARYELLIDAARRAGRHALTYFPDTDSPAFSKHVIWKDDHSPVTVADREAEAILREDLLSAYPGDGFLGEESGETASSTGYRWIVDPIDGTRSFVRGVPHWATLVALEYRGEPVAGVAYEPVINRTWHALRGGGAYRDDARLRVSTIDRLDQAVMFYSSIWTFLTGNGQQPFIDLVRRTERQRGYGDYYGHLLVAQGAGEFMVELGVHEWDLAALRIIIEEAGGEFTDWRGSPTTRNSHCISSNGRVHDAVLAILRGAA